MSETMSMRTCQLMLELVPPAEHGTVRFRITQGLGVPLRADLHAPSASSPRAPDGLDVFLRLMRLLRGARIENSRVEGYGVFSQVLSQFQAPGPVVGRRGRIHAENVITRNRTVQLENFVL